MSETPTPPATLQETPKTNGNDAASPQGEAAVRSETQVYEAAVEEVVEEPKPKVVEFHGLTLTLPDDLPGTVAFDYAEIEDDRKSVSPVFNLVKSIVGKDQYNELYDRVRDEGLGMDAVLEGMTGLMEDLFKQYGTTVGESSASDES